VDDFALALLVASSMLVLGVLASKVAGRLGVPALLLFMGIGMLAGSDGLGGIDFEDYELAQMVGVVALAFILFSGGLDTRWADVRPVLGPGIALATVGVLATACVAGTLASVVLDIPWAVGLLLGAIISSTDAAAVFSILRSQSVGLKDRLRPLLELESGSNDPMAVFLTLAFIEVVTQPGTGVFDLVPVFVMQMAVGGAVGYLLARASVAAVNRLRLGYEGLYPVLLIAVVLLTYGTAAVLGGSGFLAVYVAGIVMGNATFLHQRSLVRFSDGLAWLMQITMFLVLGLLVFPSELLPVAPRALLISAVLVLVARPVAAFAVLLLARLPVRQVAMVSWVGLRGAVPVILATFPLVEGIAEAELIFNVVFFIVLTSVLVQGTTIPVVARWLGVDAPLAPHRPPALEFVGANDGQGANLFQLTVAQGAAAAGRQLVDLRLPPGALIVLVTRAGVYLVPQGATVLEPGDSVLVLADAEALPPTRAAVEGGTGPPDGSDLSPPGT
jgi:potassium/hydrogen antiporter